jgi:hypothetical protein
LCAHSWDHLDHHQLVKPLQQIMSTHSYLIVWQQWFQTGAWMRHVGDLMLVYWNKWGWREPNTCELDIHNSDDIMCAGLFFYSNITPPVLGCWKLKKPHFSKGFFFGEFWKSKESPVPGVWKKVSKNWKSSVVVSLTALFDLVFEWTLGRCGWKPSLLALSQSSAKASSIYPTLSHWFFSLKLRELPNTGYYNIICCFNEV